MRLKSVKGSLREGLEVGNPNWNKARGWLTWGTTILAWVFKF
jgi:hypothetical protein